jgi:predicted double-glycine peptidase
VRIARLPRRWWLLGYFVPLAVVLSFRVALHWPAFGMTPPLSWLMAGSQRFMAMSLAVPLLLMTPATRLGDDRRKGLIATFAALVVVIFGIGPLAATALVRGRLAGLSTTYGSGGVCLQQTGYTCGPAAAVTGLHALGLPAEEGELGILARTNPLRGTEPGDLCDALRERYGSEGLRCEYRSFSSIEQLADACPVLAVVTFGVLVDHWVTVLHVGRARVILGDPAAGLRIMSHRAFEKRWRYTGIVLWRDATRPDRVAGGASRMRLSDATARRPGAGSCR